MTQELVEDLLEKINFQVFEQDAMILEEFNTKLENTVGQLIQDTLPISNSGNPNSLLYQNHHHQNQNYNNMTNNTMDSFKYQFGQRFSPIVSINTESSAFN